MTESRRDLPEGAPGDREALLDRQRRWRAGHTSGSSSRRVANGALLALLALAALLLSTALVLAPLFAWRTAGVALVIESSSTDQLPGVPFAAEDTAALTASLSGRMAPAVAPDLLRLKDFETAEAIRDRLHGFCTRMPLRPRDSMIAYVRGQCLVPPPLLDAEGNERPDPLGNHACLVAVDATLRGEGLRELVPIRDIVESIGSAPSRTTLIAIDLGDLRWDPRIGVLCGMVPRQLDRDLQSPQLKANGQNWVIASHDTLQYSGASGPAKRTFFAAALEQGLAGAADEAPWGDGDRVVELHELAPFVVTWTWEWSQRASGGRAPQRPGVWKLGVGRVELRDIPRDIRLVRVAPTTDGSMLAALRKRLATPAASAPAPPPPAAPAPAAAVTADPQPVTVPAVAPPVAAFPRPQASTGAVPVPFVPPGQSPPPASAGPLQPGGDASVAQTPAAEQPQPTPVEPSAPPLPPAAAAVPPSPTTAAPPPPQSSVAATTPSADESPRPTKPRPGNPRDLLGAVATRTGSAPGAVAHPTVVDYAPHLWRQAANFVAAATADAALDGPGGERARAELRRFTESMGAIDTPSSPAADRLTGSPQAESLVAALRHARASGIPRAWEDAPRQFQNAVAVRDDAVELAFSTIEVAGRLSGGAGPPFIDPGMIDGFVARIARVSDAIATASAAPPAERDPSRLDPLITATQSLIAQSSWIRALDEKLFETFSAEPASSTRVPLHDRMVLLRSRLPDASQRASLLASQRRSPGDGPGEARVAEAATQLTAHGRPSLPPAMPAVIDRVAWKNCASLASSLLNLVESAGIQSAGPRDRAPAVLQPILEEIAAARRAIAVLDNAAGDETAAREAAARLAARLTRLFERAAVTASRLPDSLEAASSGLDSERLGGLLRLVDARDASLVGDRVIVGMPRWDSTGRYGLRVEIADSAPPRIGVAVPTRISVEDSADVPAAASLSLGFDPAEIAVRLADGTKLVEGVATPMNDLPWRGGTLDLQVVPLRRASAGGRSGSTTLSAALAVDDYVEKARCPLPLPAERGVVVAVRGSPGSVAGSAGADGWVRSSRSSRVVRDVAVDEATTAHLALRGNPSRVTAWQMALEAVAGETRKVDVEIHASPSSPSPDQRERDWKDLETALLAGRPPGRPMARAKGVILDGAGRLTPLVLTADGAVETPKQADPEPPSSAVGPAGRLPSLPPATEDRGGRPIGSDLALVVHDPQATDGGPAITRIALEARHPRDAIAAVARYDERARSVTVSVAPLGGDATMLPAGGTKVVLREAEGDGPPGTGIPSTAVRTIALRKPEAVLTSAAPTGEVVASWNGPDQGTAILSLDVDGYPRAFNFAVECSSASHLRPQEPQHDWRRVRIVTPAPGRSLLRAPVSTIPMQLSVDAPADTFLGSARAGGAVEIVLRQIGAGLGDRGEERTVWRASQSRQVSFTLETAPAGSSLAIGTKVEDWSIAASGEGFANVDVSAEARLLIAGSSSPIVDSRLLVFDGRAPVIDAPPVVRATVGRPLVVPFQAADDSSDGYLIPPERRRPGVSGLKSVEWAIDADGKGMPKEWQPAVRLDGTNYELRVDTEKLPFGTRLPILVRATDAVGLSDPPTRIWLDVAADAASPLNSLTGKVVLAGRGEPDLPVRLTGPGGERTARTGGGGVFRFDDLKPGEYKVSVQAVVRNRTRKAEPVAVSVEAAPAPPATVTLDLK